ncbi:MAG: hypothetical protein H0U86_05920 [Chloroflexi bacterium]|nr:hypothetical protein [Chloroflexota bacterium]
MASPEALDAAPWREPTVVLRFAPDDAFVIGATGIDISDEHAIAEEETGFVGAWLTPDELGERVIPHIEWPLPNARPALGQGFIAGVPCKLWLTGDRALLLCPVPYAHELTERLR